MIGIVIRERSEQYRGGLRKTTKLSRVRELRREQTPAEELLWEVLRGQRFLGLKFRRQHQYRSYILDFFCPELQLVIELDGGIHDDPVQQPHDRKRDELLRSCHLHIIRLPNDMILHQLDETLRQLEATCRKIDRPNNKSSI